MAPFRSEDLIDFEIGVKTTWNNIFRFSANVLSQGSSTRHHLDHCDHIEVVVAHTGEGSYVHAAKAMSDLIADKADGEARLRDAVQNNTILQTQQISSDDPRLAQLGIAAPKAEISDNFSAGFTGDLGAFTFTVDAFQINIKDRIAITDGILVANFPAVAALFPGVREIRFFTNHIDTRTRGIDVVATWKHDIGPGELKLTLAGTHAETKVLRQRATPAALVAGASAANQALPLVGLTAIELIEVAQPRTKILLSTNYAVGGLNLGVRATHFGSVKAFSTGLNASDANVARNAADRYVQTFAAKTIVDLNAS